MAGLLLFQELGPHIVDELVRQQLSAMSGQRIREIIAGLEPQVNIGGESISITNLFPKLFIPSLKA